MRLFDPVRLRARTMRLRLTLLYSAVFAASGAALLAITYLLVSHSSGLILFSFDTPGRLGGTSDGDAFFNGDPLPRQQLSGMARQLHEHAARQQDALLHELLVQSGIALAIMVVISIALGWLVAGRALRPMRAMAATVRDISARNLHERLAVETPHDELKDLADTVDGLLGRLETSFEAQKRFVANAAHELRTPLTLERALLEETLTDRDATLAAFRGTSERLLALSEEQARRLEALLTLANSERGLDHREPFDLATLAHQVLLTSQAEIDRLGLRIDARVSPAHTSGDPTQVERLMANLIDNAVHYNVAGGRIDIATGTRDGRAFFSIVNTGPIIPPGEVDRLFEPFQRLKAERTTYDDGHHGLGLSIVRAIAIAHDAVLAPRAAPDGGLVVEVSFPSPLSTPRPRAAP
ncbi:HAMP domain-containing protein [Nonomuraea sp. K274]|uniref:histidine kinase n=1 Tax=Nonomuraea cypriaca TaxID=1187855 RepID=A0A931ABK2_9ACTN|nr:ATP-binding protein [Nonomuraea cypriaca]MBF8189811.1 HAMP domain-containing protein [Nonomuraea cypriaca]